METRVCLWERRLGAGFPLDLRRELDGETAVGDDPCIFIYLNSGVVEEVRPATSVSLTIDSLVVYYGSGLMASYPRALVFLSSKAPPPAFPNS